MMEFKRKFTDKTGRTYNIGQPVPDIYPDYALKEMLRVGDIGKVCQSEEEDVKQRRPRKAKEVE